MDDRPESENPTPNKDRGLYPKYIAFKIDDPIDLDAVMIAASQAQGIGELVEYPFFHLKFDANDQHARRALLVYALSVEGEGYYKLADDIRQKLHESRRLENGDAMDAMIMNERAEAREEAQRLGQEKLRKAMAKERQATQDEAKEQLDRDVASGRVELDVTEHIRENSHEHPYGQGNQGPGTGPDGERLI